MHEHVKSGAPRPAWLSWSRLQPAYNGHLKCRSIFYCIDTNSLQSHCLALADPSPLLAEPGYCLKLTPEEMHSFFAQSQHTPLLAESTAPQGPIPQSISAAYFVQLAQAGRTSSANMCMSMRLLPSLNDLNARLHKIYSQFELTGPIKKECIDYFYEAIIVRVCYCLPFVAA